MCQKSKTPYLNYGDFKKGIIFFAITWAFVTFAAVKNVEQQIFT